MKILKDIWSSVPGRRSGVSLVLSFLVVLCYVIPPLAPALQFEQTAVAHGEFWRVVTCHLTHWNLDHLFWDLSMFLVLGMMIEIEDRRRLLLCLAMSAISIPLLVWVVNPGVPTYRGLSGIDSALFILLMTQILRENWQQSRPVWAGAAALGMLGLLAKTIYEVQTGGTLFVDHEAAGMIPLPVAHLAGGVAGFLAAVCWPANQSRSGVIIESSLQSDGLTRQNVSRLH